MDPAPMCSVLAGTGWNPSSHRHNVMSSKLIKGVLYTSIIETRQACKHKTNIWAKLTSVNLGYYLTNNPVSDMPLMMLYDALVTRLAAQGVITHACNSYSHFHPRFYTKPTHIPGLNKFGGDRTTWIFIVRCCKHSQWRVKGRIIIYFVTCGADKSADKLSFACSLSVYLNRSVVLDPHALRLNSSSCSICLLRLNSCAKINIYKPWLWRSVWGMI